MGRPSKYKADYCQQLIGYLARGKTLEGFGSVVGVHKDTVYEWAKRHPEFAEAKSIGEARREDFMLGLGLAMASGSLKRLAKEEPVLHNGKPVLGSDGRPMMSKSYEPTNGNATVWIFMMKNMCGWRDKRDLNVGGQPDGVPISTIGRGMTREQKIAEIERLRKRRLIADAE